MRQAAAIAENAAQPTAPKSTQMPKSTQTESTQTETTEAAADTEGLCPPCKRHGFHNGSASEASDVDPACS